jgi:predicted dehydrogenase
MHSSHRISLLGTGLIGMFYTMSIHGKRSRDRVHTVCSRTKQNVEAFASEWDIPRATTDLGEAIEDPETDTVVIGLPNYLHEEAVARAAEAGKAILCTKPLGRNAAEAKRMLKAVEKAGVFAGYLEDLVYTPKTLKSLQAVRDGAIGKVLWVRSRETHPGPHSAWFWDREKAGGGALIDMGCHCIEIVRNFAGKSNRPVEVMCWADTLVHPVEAEDHGIVLIRFENGTMGQVEVSWAFHGGMDLRDEVAGTAGTIWLNHWMRTGFEMFVGGGGGGYVAEKSEAESGWVFPVGDEAAALGYVEMFVDMFDAMDAGREPMETFYDGYIVNAILDACYESNRTKSWAPVEIDEWRAGEPPAAIRAEAAEIDGRVVIKEERLPDGQIRRIYKDKRSGELGQEVVS